MSAWRDRLEDRLAAADAPAAVDRSLLRRFAHGVKGMPVADSTLTYWIKQATARGRLVRVTPGLFLNRFRSQPGMLADAAQLLRRDAIVSLNTALGDAGVLNNPSHTVTAVLPMDDPRNPPRVGQVRTAAGNFRFHALPLAVYEAGNPEDRFDRRYMDHLRATPERALVDWLYLAQSRFSRISAPPLGDLDMDMLDRKRLARLADAAGVEVPSSGGRAPV